MKAADDFTRLTALSIPARRAAYSDRTAWLMAIMAELAYEPFDEENAERLTRLAEELAALTEPRDVEARLAECRTMLASHCGTRNDRLRAALAVGGFELTRHGILYDPATDTQGFVAYKREGADLGMAVLCFRGTEKIADWRTNLSARHQPIESPEAGRTGTVGYMHKGFHSRYKTVEDQVARGLEGLEDFPLYITGHSLGGALAVVATWYQTSQRLAACYTFGAPRVCDHNLMDWFKTPIYRIVNGPDPVPFVPPSSIVITGLKMVLRTFGAVITPLNWVADHLVRLQGYRHIGYMRYLNAAEPGPRGDYPGLRLEYSLSSLVRLGRYVMTWIGGDECDRIDRYHAMDAYRVKLRAHAIRRNGA